MAADDERGQFVRVGSVDRLREIVRLIEQLGELMESGFPDSSEPTLVELITVLRALGIVLTVSLDEFEASARRA
ncbi:MAG: hypothetical protein ACRDLL_01650 [Solirubrobacterales bacterium]